MNQYNQLFADHYTELERLRQVERDYAEFREKTIDLLLHIESAIDQWNWEKIDADKWNSVSLTKLNRQEE